MTNRDLQSVTESLRVAVDAGDLGAIAEGVAELECLEARLRAEALTRADYEELDNYFQQNWPDYTRLLRTGADQETLRAAEKDMREVGLLLAAYESLHGPQDVPEKADESNQRASPEAGDSTLDETDFLEELKRME